MRASMLSFLSWLAPGKQKKGSNLSNRTSGRKKRVRRASAHLFSRENCQVPLVRQHSRDLCSVAPESPKHTLEAKPRFFGLFKTPSIVLQPHTVQIYGGNFVEVAGDQYILREGNACDPHFENQEYLRALPFGQKRPPATNLSRRYLSEDGSPNSHQGRLAEFRASLEQPRRQTLSSPSLSDSDVASLADLQLLPLAGSTDSVLESPPHSPRVLTHPTTRVIDAYTQNTLYHL